MKMKAVFLAITLFLAFSSGNLKAQAHYNNFVVLTSNDTIFGRVSVVYPTEKQVASIKVVNREVHRFIPVGEVSSFRDNKIDYVMRPGLHSEFSIPYHQVLTGGKVKLIGQQCQCCDSFLSLHVDFEDEVVCVDKSNYYDVILPKFMEVPEFKYAVVEKKTRYAFLVNIRVNRLITLVELYNEKSGGVD
jgi:hypothetical protein